MRRFGARKSGVGTLPLSRQNLKDLIAAEQKKLTAIQYFQASMLLLSAAIIFAVAFIILVLNFYAVPINFSQRGWVHVRNLTPVVSIETHVNGALEQVFVSRGQLVQKGELLGAVQTASIKLDYEETQREYAFKIIELHCFVSLQSNKYVFKLPYDAQKLVDQILDQFDISYRVNQCERELLRNATADHSLEEAIAALEDQSRLLENIANRRDPIARPPRSNLNIIYEGEADAEHPMDTNRPDMKTGAGDQFHPIVEFMQVRQKLQAMRKNYFFRKLQKEEKLGSAIEQMTQDMRYLDKRLRELNKQLDDNFIYATITGTIVGADIAKAGTYYKKFESVFALQPIENEFQVSIALKEEDADKFAVGTPALVALSNNQMTPEPLTATTVAVLRKPNGKLEAILDLEGSAKRNAEILLASGYRGEGAQRLPANITTGQGEIWKSISDVFMKKSTPNL
jgi:multidrug resistance efflux pump